VTPGSQILWTTAVSNVLDGERYGNPSGDLRNLLLGKYGPFPFYKPEDWIYEKVLGDNWRKVLEEEGGVEEIADIDLAHERYSLAEQIGTEPTDEQLILYLQHPNDAAEFFKFQEKYGQTYVLPPSVFFRKGGFEIGENLAFRDHHGKEHMVEFGPSPVNDTGETSVYLIVDHHQSIFNFKPKRIYGQGGETPDLSKEEILDLAKAGDVRSLFSGKIVEISVAAGQEVMVGDRVAILEAMKMQTPILSEIEGIVTAIHVGKGDAVKPGGKILKIDRNE
jgi:pyruvate carboxylase